MPGVMSGPGLTVSILVSARRGLPQLQTIELVVQRLEADAQDLRRAGLVIARVLQGHEDQPALGLLDGRARRQGERRLARWRRVHERRRQMAQLDELPFG